jgi:integrase
MAAHVVDRAHCAVGRDSVTGAMPAGEFGPRALKDIRQAMVDAGWYRSSVNDGVAIVVRAFKEAVASEIVSAEAVVALQCVKSLKRGELGVREGEPVKAVALSDVQAIKPYLSRQVAAIVDVMLLTGARCDEVVRMRPIDIDVSGEVWCYRPADGHKTEHLGRDRLIHIGPKCQAVVEPFLAGRPVDSPLFSPAEAEAERQQARHEQRETPESCGNKPGSNRSANPEKKPGDCYNTPSVRRAIQRACKRAGVEPWSPHQLRHRAATEIRRAAGVEAAAAVLDHHSARLTDEIYAQRDQSKAAEVIAKVG